MSFRLSSFGCCLTLTLFGGVSLVSSSAFGQGESHPRRALELSETNNTEVLGRLNQLTDRKEGLKELQGEWNKSFESSLENRANGGPLQPQYAPPRPAPISSKRMKDLLERKRNWMLTPDDLLPDNSANDWLNDSSSDTGRKNRSSSTSVKQFSEGLDRTSSGKSKPASEKSDDESDFLKSPGLPIDNSLQDDPSLPAGIRNTAKNLKSWFGSEAAQNVVNPTEARSSFEDFFGFGNGGMDREQEKAQKSYLEKYQAEVLGGNTFSPSVSTVNPLLNALAPASAPLQPLYSGGLESAASGLTAQNSGQTASTVGSALSPVAVPDLNARALNQWNTLYSPPRQDLPKTTPPTFPSMDFPRRRF